MVCRAAPCGCCTPQDPRTEAMRLLMELQVQQTQSMVDTAAALSSIARALSPRLLNGDSDSPSQRNRRPSRLSAPATASTMGPTPTAFRRSTAPSRSPPTQSHAAAREEARLEVSACSDDDSGTDRELPPMVH